MSWRAIARLTKILGALTAIMVGVWALASESSRPLVTDAVTNTRLVEIFAPADGKLAHIIAEGSQFVSGDELARTTPAEPPDVVPAEPPDVVDQESDNAAIYENTNTLGIPTERSAEAISRIGLLDSRTNPQIKRKRTDEIRSARATETSLRSETSGAVWQWSGASNTTFTFGESVGYIAECLNLIAIGQAKSSQTSAIRVGDPIVFITEDKEWKGTVRLIVAGVPNLPGQYAIQFPTIDSNSSLLFFNLIVPTEYDADCALGVSGQIHYPLNARRSSYDVSVAVIGDATAVISQTWDRVRNVVRPVYQDTRIP